MKNREAILQELGIAKDKILSDIVDYQSQDVVFVAGSLVESMVSDFCHGMGNRLSDIDIFVLSNDSSVDKQVILKDAGHTFYDIEVYDLSIVEHVVERISQCNFDNVLPANRLVQLQDNIRLFDYVSLLHRFSYGIPIFNENKFDQLRQGFDRNNYLHILRRREINNFDNPYNDCIGNLEKGNLDVAIYLSRCLIISAIKIFLFSQGLSLDRDKWILLKLKNMDSPKAKDLYHKFGQLYYSGLHTDKDKQKNIKDTLKFCNSIIEETTQEYGF
jgi:hypothetical protein